MLAHGAEQSTRTLCAPISYIMEKKKKKQMAIFPPDFIHTLKSFKAWPVPVLALSVPLGALGGQVGLPWLQGCLPAKQEPFAPP